MSDQEEKKENQITNFGDDFAAKFAEFIRQSMQTTPNPPKSTTANPENPGEIVVKTKLSGDNYPLWENLMTRAIGGKGYPPTSLGIHFLHQAQIQTTKHGRNWII